MASKKEYTMLFALNASLNGGFQTTFTKASSAVAGMQKEIQALAKEQSDISAYEKQQKGIEATEKKLEVLKQQYDNIQKEIQETEGFSSSLENKLLSKQQQIDKTSDSLEKQNQKLNEMGTALQEAGVDTSSLTSESKRLEKEMEEIKDKQEEAAESAEEYGNTASAAFDAVSNALIAAGITDALKEIAKAYGECVKLSADFDSAMSQVAATMGRSKDDMGELTEFAKKMGAETKFTAIEAAEGENILAMAGLKDKEIMAALPTVLNLASAGAMDLAQSAAYVAGTVKGFSDSMDNAGYYADLMAKGATMANTNVQQLGEAMGASAATASSYGQSADSVTLSLLRLAEQNVAGAEAGNALNRAMADLYTPTKDAQGALEALGVAVYDEYGDARDFNDVVDDLNASLQEYSMEEQNAYKNTIFTTRGLQAFNKMTVSTTEKVNEFWTGLQNASGSAGKQAETQIDNLNGKLTIMNSAWDGLKTTLGGEFNDELEGLVDIGTDMLSGINAFAKANPGLVKGIITTTGVLVGATTAIVGVSAAIKAVEAASAALSLAVPGIGAILGVTAAVAALAGGIVALSSDASDTVPSVKELTTAARDLKEGVEEANESFADTVAEAQATVNVADMYIDKLAEMNVSEESSEEQKKEYLNVCELLKGVMPELTEYIDEHAKTYDLDTEAMKQNTQAFLENAEAQARQEYLTEVREKYNDVLKEQAVNEIKLTEATIKKEAADKKVAEAEANLDAIFQKAKKESDEYYEKYGMVIDATMQYQGEIDEATRLLQQYGDEQWECERAVSNITKAMNEDAAAVAEAEAAIASADEAVARLTGTTDEAEAETEDFSGKITLLGTNMENVYSYLDELRKGYEEAYNAAKSSLEGQYALWDEVAKVSEVSTSSITEKIGQQTEYWKNYNENLSSLRDRAGDIEGLAEVIGSFADGSEESVNAVAGMASASDEDLKAMVENYQDLRKAQDETSENIAAMATNFDVETQKIADSTKQMVSDMNLESEARQAARETIQGYIDMASSMSGDVGAAYRKVAKAASSGLMGTVSSPVPGKKYAEGTDNAASGLALVGEEGPELVMMHGGEKVIPADKTSKLLEEPVQSAGSTNNISVNFNISGSASEDVISRLDEYAEDFAERVLAVVSEAEEDRKRRSYT